jgi:hypothetical protein
LISTKFNFIYILDLNATNKLSREQWNFAKGKEKEKNEEKHIKRNKNTRKKRQEKKRER